MESKISVIVPVYKAEKYIRRCVDSILAQTYQNLEIILVDDGSPDHCPAICDEYAGKDSRVKVIHKENGGELSAREAGISAAQGEWLGFVDSDDFVSEDMYGYLLQLTAENNVDIVQCGFDTCIDSKIIKSYAAEESVDCDGRQAVRHLLTGNMNWMVMWNKLYRRELFQNEQLNRDLKCSGDALANYFLMRKAKKVVFSNEAKYHYGTNQDSALRQKYQPYHILDPRRYLKIVGQEEGENSDLLPDIRRAQVADSIAQAMYILHSGSCLEYYDMLMDEIKANRQFIFHSGLFRRQDKVKAQLLLTNRYLAKLVYGIYRRRSLRN